LGGVFFGGDNGLEEGGDGAAVVKKCPVDTFLARGRVHGALPQPLRLMAELHLLVKAGKRCRKKEVDISTNVVYNTGVDSTESIYREEGYAG